MKIISLGIVVASLATFVVMSTSSGTQALYVPSSTYCLDIGVSNLAGYTYGCGYTYNECMRRLPGILSEVKKKYPKAVASCNRQR